jgi:hypothetical protein
MAFVTDIKQHSTNLPLRAEAGLFKSSSLATALGETKHIIIIIVNLIALCCAP